MKPLRRLAFTLLLFSALLGSGCVQESDREKAESIAVSPPPPVLRSSPEGQRPASPPGQNADTSVPSEGEISLAQLAAEAHASADRAGTSEKQLSAARELEKVFLHSSQEASPQAIVVRQDLAARAAQLYLTADQPNEAERIAKAGIHTSSEPSIPLASLLVARADAEEMQGKKEQMRASLVEAMKVNQKLMEKELLTP